MLHTLLHRIALLHAAPSYTALYHVMLHSCVQEKAAKAEAVFKKAEAADKAKAKKAEVRAFFIHLSAK